MAEAPRRRSVLFIITHDVGRVMGAYGNPAIHTPHMDALTRTGVRFDGHFCQWPLCGPSRANLFTGLRPPTTRRFDNTPFLERFRPAAPRGFASMPEHFRAHGYDSFGAGWVYHDNPDEPSWSAGYYEPGPAAEALPDWAAGWLDAEYFEWQAPESRELIRARLEEQRARGVTREEFRSLAGQRGARGPAVERAEVSDDAYYDGRVAARAREFLETRDPRRPFFAAVGFVAPHTPFRAPARYWDLYARDALRLPDFDSWPAGCDDYMAGDSEPAQYYTTFGYSKPWRASRAQSLELLHGHYAAISYIDALIGRLVETLRRRGIDKDTIIVFTADHGYHEGEHGYWGKHNLWDKSLQVPLIMSLPGRTAPVVVDRVTEHVDVFPTLCELAGLAPPSLGEGRSAVRLLEGDCSGWKDAAVSHRAPMWHDRLKLYAFANSIRTPTVRYTEYLDDKNALIGEELYDYSADPAETANIAFESGSRGLRGALREELHRRLTG